MDWLRKAPAASLNMVKNTVKYVQRADGCGFSS